MRVVACTDGLLSHRATTAQQQAKAANPQKPSSRS